MGPLPHLSPVSADDVESLSALAVAERGRIQDMEIDCVCRLSSARVVNRLEAPPNRLPVRRTEQAAHILQEEHLGLGLLEVAVHSEEYLAFFRLEALLILDEIEATVGLARKPADKEAASGESPERGEIAVERFRRRRGALEDALAVRVGLAGKQVAELETQPLQGYSRGVDSTTSRGERKGWHADFIR